MPADNLPAHSPLGASSAERWLNCPGSTAELPVALAEALESDDPEYRRAGTAAHAAGAHCLENTQDAWEIEGQEFEGYAILPDMVPAIQVYLDECRLHMAEEWGVEMRVHRPEVSPHFYGTTDFWALKTREDGGQTLVIRDYKNGAGVVVEVENNAQISYYAIGVLLALADRDVTPDLVDLGIVQPNVPWHPGGVVRRWIVRPSVLYEWLEAVLKPGMAMAVVGNDLLPGEWCRFCPRKLICPALRAMYGAAAVANTGHLEFFTDDELSREWLKLEPVKSYIKAVQAEAMRRLAGGKSITDLKLVHGRSNRVWKEEASAALRAALGEAAYSTPALLSPAQIEALGPEAKSLTRRYAYSPPGSLTVVASSDSRTAVTVDNSLKENVQKMIDNGMI